MLFPPGRAVALDLVGMETSDIRFAPFAIGSLWFQSPPPRNPRRLPWSGVRLDLGWNRDATGIPRFGIR